MSTHDDRDAVALVDDGSHEDDLFGVVYDWLTFESGLTDRELRAWIVLKRCAMRGAVSRWSIASMAALAGKSAKTFREAVHGLAEKGRLRITARDGRPNEYRILPLPPEAHGYRFWIDHPSRNREGSTERTTPDPSRNRETTPHENVRPPLTISGGEREVERTEREEAAASAAAIDVDQVITALNEVTGARWSAAGWRPAIQAAISAHPELSIDDYRRVIAAANVAPWRRPGALTPNHVFGSVAQFERCIADAGTTAAPGATPAARHDDGLEPWERDALQRFENSGVDAHLHQIDQEGSPAARDAATEARAKHQEVAA